MSPVVGPADALAPRPAGRRLILRSHGRVLDAITERLKDEPPPGLAWCDVAVRPGSGGRTVLRVLAREARLVGWIPGSASLIVPATDGPLRRLAVRLNPKELGQFETL